MSPTSFLSSRWLRVLLGVGVTALVVVVTAQGLARVIGGAVGETGEDTETVSVAPNLDVEIEVPPGASARQIGNILAEAGVITSANEFELEVRDQGIANQLRAGTYQLVTGMGIDAVIPVLLRGPVADAYRVTIPEGLRVSEIIAILAEASGREVESFETALLEGEVATELRVMPEQVTLSDWEGLLFPDTYEFLRDSPPSEILQILSDTMQERAGGVDWTAITEAGFDSYQGIIIASLIEAEVRVADERPLVSSVIFNRLAEGMPLQIDASVLYGLNTRDPALFNNESESLYNLYLYAGLPPTPIGAPGRASLEAAAAPATSDFFFYVLSTPEGGHAFAETFDEHLANIERSRAAGILP
ncbi:MAG TPA: endolytic transglycosylase MltG [Acidimicrobiia bacterium]|nr:endolytic transglycosylase MltG [Acidimicrobiia bacterium]